MGKCVDPQKDAFAKPTPLRLEAIGAGCFVQVCLDGECNWVEITSVEGEQYIGQSQPTLSETTGNSAEPGNMTVTQIQKTSRELKLRKENITALGCERYCFC